jgi:predicted nucleic acid-binding protein
MSGAEPFFTFNVLVYLLSSNEAKADREKALLAEAGVVIVQVLNECASLATRKLSITIPEVRQALEVVCAICRVAPLTEETQGKGLVISER